MPEQDKIVQISGFPVDLVRVGRRTLVINDNVTVVIPMMDNDPEQPEGDEGCLACKISKISQCADVVCP